MDQIVVMVADETMPSTLHYEEWIFEHFIKSPAAAERLVERSAVAELRRTLLFIEMEYPGSGIMGYFEAAVRASLPSLRLRLSDFIRRWD